MKKLLSILLLFVVLIGTVLLFFPDKLPEKLSGPALTVRRWIQNLEELIHPQPQADSGSRTYEVIRAVDGDTLLVSLDGQSIAVRLIGIDAPESVHPETEKNTPEGELASQWMKRFIQGKRVTLEYDQELKDHYGRTLAYVYVDGVLLEDILLTAGMARTLTMEPNTRYQYHFEHMEKEAREACSGFWGTGFYER